MEELDEIEDEFSNSPLTTIDTQNKIWLRIMTREQHDYEVKGRMMKKQMEEQSTSTIAFIGQRPLQSPHNI